MALKKCRLCYFPIAFFGKILQDLVSFLSWKGAFDINKNLNTHTAALKGGKNIFPKSKDKLFRFLMLQKCKDSSGDEEPKSFCLILYQETGWGTVDRNGIHAETERSPGVPLLLLTGWSLDQS